MPRLKSAMTPANAVILAPNGGSSSIRFSLYRLRTVLERGLHSKLDRIGLSRPVLSFSDLYG